MVCRGSPQGQAIALCGTLVVDTRRKVCAECAVELVASRYVSDDVCLEHERIINEDVYVLFPLSLEDRPPAALSGLSSAEYR